MVGLPEEIEPFPINFAHQPQNTSGIGIKQPLLYHCTVCKEPRSYKNDSDWKKHEKEHEFDYTCTPDGGRGKTPTGTKCVICGTLEPDEQHALEHNTAQTCHYTCKRRDHMTKHLTKCHGVLDSAQARALAKAWLRASGRRFWSCGLCVCDKPFTNLQERLRHIDLEHFRKHHSIQDWDATKVILGLLRQPDVSEAWKAQLTKYPGWEHVEVKWEASNLGDLQFKLEMGASDKQSARALAEAAYNVCVIRTSDVWNLFLGWAGDHEKSTWLSDTPSIHQSRSTSYHPHSTQTQSSEILDGDTLHTPMLSGSAAGNRLVADSTMYQPLSDRGFSISYTQQLIDLGVLRKLIMNHIDNGSQQFTDPVLFLGTGNDASVGTQQWWNSD